jgi:hypothetical protein
MFSKSNRWALSISTVAITVVGTFSSLNAAVTVSPTAGCRQGDIVGAGVSTAPAIQRSAAQAASNAYSTPDVPLTRFTRQTSGGVSTVELEGEIGADNFCNLEVDVIANTRNIEEIEEQIPGSAYSSRVPAAVRQRLQQQLPNYRITFIEKSTRPQPGPRPVPPLTPNRVVYEIEGDCTGTNPIPGPTAGNYCVNGQSGEAQISSDGNNFVFAVTQQ